MNERFWQACGVLGDQGDVLRSMSRGFHGKDAELDLGTAISCMLVAAAFLTAIWVLSRWAAPKERLGSYRSPRALFLALCRAHGLDRSQRRILRRLARLHGMPQPAALFLRPECFVASTLGAELQQQRESVERLHAKLFADLPPPSPLPAAGT